MSGKEYRTITDVKGPLVFLEKTEPVAYGEIVQLRLSDGSMKNGQVLDTSDDQVIVQVFEGTASVDRQTGVKFLGDVFKLPVSKGLIGRILDGAGKPRDGGPEIVAEEMADIIGAAINPYSRESPEQFIQTGISAIDACTSLVRGQKLPIFSASGLPHNDIALQIARQAKLVGSDDDFVVVFCAMGITAEEYNFFVHDLERTGALENAALFVNLADDPAVERLITPRLALTAAEYLAFEHDYHVLVIYTDKLLRVSKTNRSCPRGSSWKTWISWIHVYRLSYAIRESRHGEGQEREHYSVPNSNYARRRYNTSNT